MSLPYVQLQSHQPLPVIQYQSSNIRRPICHPRLPRFWGWASLSHLHILLLHPGNIWGQRLPFNSIHAFFGVSCPYITSTAAFCSQEHAIFDYLFGTHHKTRTDSQGSSSVKSTELKAGAGGAEPLSSYLTLLRSQQGKSLTNSWMDSFMGKRKCNYRLGTCVCIYTYIYWLT